MNAVTLRQDRLGSLLSLFCAGTASAADGNRSLVEQVRAANDRFKDVAVAVSEGYAPIPCASGVDGGAMGVHYVNASLIGEIVDLKAPQAIMYEPTADGKMELIAVEYITHQGAGLARRPALQFHRRAQSLRPRPVLRAACLGLESRTCAAPLPT